MTPPPADTDAAPATLPFPAPPRPRRPFRNEVITSVRRLLTSASIFVILFLFVRTFFLEPFGVPTGSMSVSFLGNHRECDCPRCGYRVVVGEPGPHDNGTLDHTACPNCGERNLRLTDAREIPGDRLLVDKNVYSVRTPRRWEVAVFRCPVDDSKPYVKRVVGLPGEAVQLKEGDAYANGVLLRKTLPQCRECYVPVFDLAAAPTEGWGSRFTLATMVPNAETLERAADTAVLHDGVIQLDALATAPGALGLTYHHSNRETQRDDAITDWLAYNGGPKPRRPQPAHDFAVTFELEITAGTGVFAVRLDDGAKPVSVEIPVGAPGTATLGDGDTLTLQYAVNLAAGKRHRVEFVYFDRVAMVSIDGVTFGSGVELPKPDATRPGVSKPVQIGVQGANVLLHNFKILRDIHYRADGRHGCDHPHPLADREYFVLGDNSNNSNDSREWRTPGVPERDFLGKPFLIHQPLKLGKMTVGGQERTYQAIDWPRLRWLR